MAEHDRGRSGKDWLDVREFKQQLLDLSLLTGTSNAFRIHTIILPLRWKRCKKDFAMSELGLRCQNDHNEKGCDESDHNPEFIVRVSFTGGIMAQGWTLFFEERG